MKQQLLSADPQSRRLFLERCAQAAYGLSVLPFLNLTSSRAVAGEAKPAAPVVRGAGFGTAKNIIILNLAGGMSHIDTFDPKTGEAKGPKAAIRTKADFQVTEYLPRIASIADKISVIRSMTAKLGGHELARYFMRTGFEKRGTIKHPWLGAWAQHYLGPSHKTLPSSVCINRNSEHGNGFFPATFSPLPILDPDEGLQNSRPTIGLATVQKRLNLANDLDQSFRQEFHDENVSAYNDFYEATVRLMNSSDLKAFDVAAEPGNLRDAYGRSKFGQGCLLARRLIENGIRAIEVQSGGWDMHSNLGEAMETHGGEFDQSFTALINDLESRGLLKTTLVAVITEFGRKPEWQGTGRGHYPKAFTTLLAGAGIKRGYVHGATDALGAEVTRDPVTVGNLHATIGHAAGLPLEQPATSPSGRPFTVGNKAAPISEVFA